VEPGDDLLAVDAESVARRVSRHPRIASARVTRGWNRVLRVEVVERPPVALWMGERLLEVAADGTVLGPPPEGERDWPVPAGRRDPRGLGLPLLTGIDARGIHAGQHVPGEGARQALAFLARLRAYGLDGDGWISEIWAHDPGGLVAVTLDGGIPVRLGDGRLGPRKVKALRTVLDRVAGEEDPVDFVDARFRHQVIVKRAPGKAGPDA
jgi:cell division septal protein FtsQ